MSAKLFSNVEILYTNWSQITVIVTNETSSNKKFENTKNIHVWNLKLDDWNMEDVHIQWGGRQGCVMYLLLLLYAYSEHIFKEALKDAGDGNYLEWEKDKQSDRHPICR